MNNHITQTQKSVLKKLDKISNIKDNDVAIYKFIHLLSLNPSLSRKEKEAWDYKEHVELMRKYSAERYLQLPTIKDKPTKNCLKQIQQIKGNYVLLVVEELDSATVLAEGTTNDIDYLTVKPVSRSYINKMIKITKKTILGEASQNLIDFHQSYSYNSIYHALKDVGFNFNKYYQNPCAKYLISNLYNIDSRQKDLFKIETIKQAYDNLNSDEISIMKDINCYGVEDDDDEALEESCYSRLSVDKFTLSVQLNTDPSKELICVISDPSGYNLKIRPLIDTQYLTYKSNGVHVSLQQLVYDSLLKTIAGRIKLLLKSDINSNDIERHTGVNHSIIDKLRNGNYQLDKLYLNLAEKLDMFIKKYTINVDLKEDDTNPKMVMK